MELISYFHYRYPCEIFKLRELAAHERKVYLPCRTRCYQVAKGYRANNVTSLSAHASRLTEASKLMAHAGYAMSFHSIQAWIRNI
jgi:hypothetical protein